MAKSNESIKLHGGQAEQFRRLRDRLEDSLGYRPTKPRVIGHLMEHYNGDLLEE